MAMSEYPKLILSASRLRLCKVLLMKLLTLLQLGQHGLTPGNELRMRKLGGGYPLVN
jgi:hypothetical protein